MYDVVSVNNITPFSFSINCILGTIQLFLRKCHLKILSGFCLSCLLGISFLLFKFSHYFMYI